MPTSNERKMLSSNEALKELRVNTIMVIIGAQRFSCKLHIQ